MMKYFPIIITAPSGTGKTTICNILVQEVSHLKYSISATTRPPRPGEVDGKDYIFLSPSKFLQWIEEEKFAEWAYVHNHYYGTPKFALEEDFRSGYDVIMDIDVQGGIKMMELYPDGVYIFLLPPSMEELERRLRNRSTDTDEQINLRLIEAHKEMEYVCKYQYVVINDEIDVAVKKIKSIIYAERYKTLRKRVDFEYLTKRRI